MWMARILFSGAASRARLDQRIVDLFALGLPHRRRRAPPSSRDGALTEAHRFGSDPDQIAEMVRCVARRGRGTKPQ